MGMKKILGTTVGSTLLAAFLLFSSVGVAAAQNSETVVLGGSNMQSSAQTNGTEAAVAISIGFNYVHATYCLGAAGFYYFVAQEGSVWWTNDPIALIALAPACQTGNLVGFRVINSSNAWDQVVVLPTK